MKSMKKITALLLALVMVMSMTTIAFAETTSNGKITINNAVSGKTYKLYRILDLVDFNAEQNSYVYTIADNSWHGFLTDPTIDGVYVSNYFPEGGATGTGYVTWFEGADAKEFADLALAYAKEFPCDVIASKTAESDVVEFTGLPLGYYLIESSAGTAVILTTTDPDAVVYEKNGSTTVDKVVKEDSTGEWGKVNDADFDQRIDFKATIKVEGNAIPKYYVDVLENLLVDGQSVKVYLNGVLATYGEDWGFFVSGDFKEPPVFVDVDNYSHNYPDLTNAMIIHDAFVILFEDMVEQFKSGDEIVIEYQAIIPTTGNVGDAGNKNDAYVVYDQNGTLITTPPSTTESYTWEFDVLKYGSGNKETVLEGAEFVLVKGDKVAKFAENYKFKSWVAMPADGKYDESCILTSGKDGKILVQGLDADTYKLIETKAPAGYNKVDEPIEFTISRTINAQTGTMTQVDLPTIEVNNNAGAELPHTGGIGTTIFYVLGSVMVLGAAILLVTKKRMGDIA